MKSWGTGKLEPALARPRRQQDTTAIKAICRGRWAGRQPAGSLLGSRRPPHQLPKGPRDWGAHFSLGRLSPGGRNLETSLLGIDPQSCGGAGDRHGPDTCTI